jgi:hypothetical protein
MSDAQVAAAVQVARTCPDRWVGQHLPLQLASVWSAAAARRPRPRWMAKLLLDAVRTNGLWDVIFDPDRDTDQTPPSEADRGRLWLTMVLEAELGPKTSRNLFDPMGRGAAFVPVALARVAAATEPARTGLFVKGALAPPWRTVGEVSRAVNDMCEHARSAGAPAWAVPVARLLVELAGRERRHGGWLGGDTFVEFCDRLGPSAKNPAIWLILPTLTKRSWSGGAELADVAVAAAT